MTLQAKKLSEVDKLENFINGIGATRQLLSRAHSEGYLLEALVLYATVVDGLLRMALLLSEQIASKTSNINEKYIFQDESASSYLSEWKIYKLASEERVIEDDLFNEISALYEVRNKAIHRFLISEIEYSHLELVLGRYELVFQRLWTVVYNLESEQISKKIGMTISGKVDEKDRSNMLEQILTKIKSGKPEPLKRTLGSLIKDNNSFSETEERERIANEISDELEIQKEKKVIPSGFASVKEITKWAERRGLFTQCICGHEKVHHVHLDNSKTKEELLAKPTSCNTNGCACVKYAEKI